MWSDPCTVVSVVRTHLPTSRGMSLRDTSLRDLSRPLYSLPPRSGKQLDVMATGLTKVDKSRIKSKSGALTSIAVSFIILISA